MIGIIIASHGKFAEGVYHAGTMIFGEQEKVKTVSLQPEEGPEDLLKKYNLAIDELGDVEGILFLVDFLGGTPFNVASRLLQESDKKIAVVTGLNLPMLVEAYGARFTEEDVFNMANYLREVGQEAIKVVPDKNATEEKDDIDDMLDDL
jgi:PTS system mannose-specific IIB component